MGATFGFTTAPTPNVSHLDLQAFNTAVNNTGIPGEQLKELPADKPSQHYRGVASVSDDRKENWTEQSERVDTHLSDRHGTEDIQEDEGAVCGVIPQQVSVRQSLDVRKRREGELCHHSAIKSKMKR